MHPRVGVAVEEIRSAVRAQGFLLIESLFCRRLMDDLREQLDAARVREEARFGLDALREIGQDGYVSDLLSIGPALEEVLDSDELHEILCALLGQPRLFVGQGIILDPGKGRGIWPRCWHADMFDVSSAIGDPRFCVGINFLLLVDDISLANGPTGVLPGSQRMRALRVEREEDLQEIEFRAVAPSGSVLLIEGGTWHSAGLNTTDRPRRVLKLLFTREWIRPQIDYAAATPPSVTTRLPERVKQILRIPESRA
jgi:hypothetical protein